MKELSIEEKAQAYDKALEIINDYYQKIKYSSLSNASTDREVLEKAFPELAESEDERIRKALIYHYQGDGCISTNEYRIDYKDIRAWLEKQGDANKEYWRGYRKGKQEILDKYAEFGKQGEQKPIDEAEPKFKQGEWIIRNNEYTGISVQVIEFKGYYRCDLNGEVVTFTPNDVHNNFHLWTIKDAKDGDVLAVEPIEGYSSSFVAIYKKQNEEDFDSYCFVGFDGKFYDGENGHSTEGIHPAIKEQRDTLMKAMADAGYTFDFEKKELKKIEQKPAWSEEDETKIKSIIALLKSPALCAMDGNKGIIDESIKYLKSIKDRVQPQHKEWSEEDEENFNWFEKFFRAESVIAEGRDIPQDRYMWFKNLKDRVRPKQEWSEEDEKIIKRIDSLLYSQCKIHGSEYEEIHNWFKSLRPQSTWKPSDIQMRILSIYTDQNNTHSSVLASLYNDLKKLREE